MIYDFFYEKLNFLCENLNFLYENLRISLSKILMIFFMIFFKIHKISYYKIRVSTGSVQTHWLGGNFSVVYKTTLAGWVLSSPLCASKLAGWVKKAVSVCRDDPVPP